MLARSRLELLWSAARSGMQSASWRRRAITHTFRWRSANRREELAEETQRASRFGAVGQEITRALGQGRRCRFLALRLINQSLAVDGQMPQAGGPIFRRGDDRLAVARETDRRHVVDMAAKGDDRLADLPLPYPRGLIP